MTSLAYRTLHSLENDGITPSLFTVLSKERKGSEMTSAPVCIPPTLVFERGFVKAMFQTEISKVDGDRLVPVETDSLPKKFLNMNTAKEAGYRLEVKKKLGRDVILKEVYQEFIADTKETDIVAVLMMCQYKDRDDYSSFKYLDQSGLYKFLMQTVDRPRSMLQKFVQPKGRNNTLIFAVWSPLVLVAEGRRSVHGLNEITQTPDDRGVTFESDDVRLVRELALPKTVIDEITTTCLAIKSHVETAERGLSLTRLACYFKIDQYSTLHLIAATSIRLQKTARTEIRHPLDLNCGAASPFRDREGETAKLIRDLEECERKQELLRSQLSKGIPSSSGTSLMDEARKRASSPSNLATTSSSSISRSQKRPASASSFASRHSEVAQKFKGHQKTVYSGAVLPGGEIFPNPNSAESYKEQQAYNFNSPQLSAGSNKFRGTGSSGYFGSSSSPPPSQHQAGTPSWQRHRTHIQQSSAGPSPQKNHHQQQQTLLEKHQQRQLEQQQQQQQQQQKSNDKPPKAVRPNSPEQIQQPNSSPSERVSFTPQTQKQQQQQQQQQQQYRGSGGGGNYYSSGLSSSSASGDRRGKGAAVNVGTSVESGIVLDALSSIPRASHAQPFSAVFTRRIVQEERVSNSWHSFLNRQKKELATILSHSPVNNNNNNNNVRGDFDASTSVDQTRSRANTLQSQGSFSNASFYSQQQTSQMKRMSEPYPAGDMTVDFDSVTRRSAKNRHKVMMMSNVAAGAGAGDNGISMMFGGSGGDSFGGGGGDALPQTTYARSLRQAQLAYMSPSSSLGQQQQQRVGRSKSIIIGQNNSNNNGDGGDENNSNNINNKNGSKPPKPLIQDKPIEPDEVPDLIGDTSQLPKMKSKEGKQADATISMPNSVPKQVSTSTVIPTVFGAPNVNNQVDKDASLKNSSSNNNNNNSTRVGSASTPSKRLTRFQQEQQRKAEQEHFQTQKQQAAFLDGVVVHEATPKYWHLRSAHPEVSVDDIERLKQHVGPLQGQAVSLMFEFVRHVVHHLRSEARKMILACSKNNSSNNNNSMPSGKPSSSSSTSSSLPLPIYFELPSEMLRTSITLDDIVAMFQPLQCKVVSRGEGLKILHQHAIMAAQNEKDENSRTISSNSVLSLATSAGWNELSAKRSEALSKIDPVNFKRMFDFPSQNPATDGFFTTAGTAVILFPPVAATTTTGSDSLLQSIEQLNKTYSDILNENDADADTNCGLDYLLNEENGSVAFVCLKSLPMAKPDGRGGVVNTLPF